jgi:hypothetical protein
MADFALCGRRDPDCVDPAIRQQIAIVGRGHDAEVAALGQGESSRIKAAYRDDRCFIGIGEISDQVRSPVAVSNDFKSSPMVLFVSQFGIWIDQVV